MKLLNKNRRNINESTTDDIWNKASVISHKAKKLKREYIETQSKLIAELEKLSTEYFKAANNRINDEYQKVFNIIKSNRNFKDKSVFSSINLTKKGIEVSVINGQVSSNTLPRYMSGIAVEYSREARKFFQYDIVWFEEGSSDDRISKFTISFSPEYIKTLTNVRSFPEIPNL